MTILSAAALESDPLGCSLLAGVIGLKRGDARTPVLVWSRNSGWYSSCRQGSRPAVTNGPGASRIKEFDESPKTKAAEAARVWSLDLTETLPS
jgi:hypothetical protein